MVKTSIYTDLDNNQYGFTTYAKPKVLQLEHCDNLSFKTYCKAKKVFFNNSNNELCIALLSYGAIVGIYNTFTNTLHTSKRYWNKNIITKRHQYAFLKDLKAYLDPNDVYIRLTA